MRHHLSLVALVVLVAAFAMPPALSGQEEEEQRRPSALFDSHEVLEFTLETDLDRLKDDRGETNAERPARILIGGEDGETLEIPLQVRTRGNFRLRRATCSFPPIRLNFKQGQLEGTPFDGEDKLKLVAHCKDRDQYEQNVLEEYVAYRIFNLLSDVGFQVRLARLTYVDTSGKDKPATRYAFLIEDEEAMAARLGGTMIEVAQAHPSGLNPEQGVLVSVFQYMIGNTDWSLVGFHNIKLMRRGFTDYVAIPYDFDFSGLVDAPYAGPNPLLEDFIRSVRDRLYRGFCWEGVDYQAVYAVFNERQEAIYEMIRGVEGLKEDNIEDAIDYLDEFYETINNSRRAEREILDACRRW